MQGKRRECRPFRRCRDAARSEISRGGRQNSAVARGLSRGTTGRAASARGIGLRGTAGERIDSMAAHQRREVFTFVTPGDQRALTFAREVGATWAGFSNEPPPHSRSIGSPGSCRHPSICRRRSGSRIPITITAFAVSLPPVLPATTAKGVDDAVVRTIDDVADVVAEDQSPSR
jgi:hypothetical protein